MTDIQYHIEGFFTSFAPVSREGVAAWEVMQAQNGAKILTVHLPSVLMQLKQAGYSVRKARFSKKSDDALLAELLA
jgi:hypothetical protein